MLVGVLLLVVGLGVMFARSFQTAPPESESFVGPVPVERTARDVPAVAEPRLYVDLSELDTTARPGTAARVAREERPPAPAEESSSSDDDVAALPVSPPEPPAPRRRDREPSEAELFRAETRPERRPDPTVDVPAASPAPSGPVWDAYRAARAEARRDDLKDPDIAREAFCSAAARVLQDGGGAGLWRIRRDVEQIGC